MGLDPFEKELFDSLNDYKSSLNKGEAWEQLAKKLQAPKKKKRRLIPFWLNLLGLAAIIAIAAYTLTQSEKEDLHKTKSIVTKHTARQNTNQANSDFHANSTEPNSNAATQVHQNNSIEEHKTYQHQNSISTHNANNLTSTVLKNVTTEKLAQTITTNTFRENVQNAVKQFPKNTFSTSIQHKNNSIVNDSRIKSTALIAAFSQIAIINNTSNNKLNFESALTAFNRLPQHSRQSVSIKNVEKNLRSLSFNLYASYGLSNFNRTGSNPEQDMMAYWLNEQEDELDHTSLGMEVHKQISSYFSIFSGLNFNVSRSSFKYQDTLNVYRELDNVVYQKEIYQDGTITERTSTQEVEHIAKIDAKLGQTYRYLSVPLGVSLHSSKQKKFYFQSDLAFHLSLLQNFTGRKILTRNSDYSIVNNHDFERSPFQSLHTRLIFGTSLQGNLKLQIGIAQNWDLNSRLNTDSEHQFKIQQTGIHLALSRIF